MQQGPDISERWLKDGTAFSAPFSEADAVCRQCMYHLAVTAGNGTDGDSSRCIRNIRLHCVRSPKFERSSEYNVAAQARVPPSYLRAPPLYCWAVPRILRMSVQRSQPYRPLRPAAKPPLCPSGPIAFPWNWAWSTSPFSCLRCTFE